MEFFGLLGEKLSHSLSPKIHKRIFELTGINGGYKLFPVSKEEVGKVSDSIKLFGIKGMNVTIPYKEVVMEQLDSISDEAKKIGAINTILLKENRLYGYNTDYYGFGKMLQINNVDVENKIAVILGNGGAAKAVIEYMLDNNVKELYLVSRNKNTKGIKDSRVNLIDYVDLNSLEGDVLINTTPLGMYPKMGISPVSIEVIEKFTTLVDLIYNPRETEFLKLGKNASKKICGGLYMLVGQAVKSQEIWQGREIDDDVINIIYDELNKEFN